jgi:hypothetical protein
MQTRPALYSPALPRKLYLKSNLFFSVLLVFISFRSASQCISFPAFPGCSPAGAITAVSGATVNSGQTHVFSGTGTFASLTLNGGKLIVCGTLTLSSIAVSSGTIFVQQGAVLTVSNGGSALAFGANTCIFNYGKIDFKMSIVTGASNLLVNCLPTSVFLVAFDQFVLQGPNTYLVNNGFFNSSYFIVQGTNSANPVCLGTGSILQTSIMINQYTNSIYTPLGSAACVNVTNMVINSNTVTATIGTNICIPASLNVVSGPNWGNATMMTSCTGCIVLLPVELLSFSGWMEEGTAVLNWETLSERDNCNFILQRSVDGLSYTTISTFNGAVNSDQRLHYQAIDNTIEPGYIYYYRLKQVDCSGKHTYSNVIDLSTNSDIKDKVTVIPNPAYDHITILNSAGSIETVELYNAMGELIMRKDFCLTLDLSDYAPGIYYLKLERKKRLPLIKKIQKL